MELKNIFLKKQKGQVSIEFLFSIVLALGLFHLFFALTYTFVVVEVTQYVAFSVARAQLGSQATRSDQFAAAKNKFANLTENPQSPIGSLYSKNGTGWFVLSKPDFRPSNGGPDDFKNLMSATADDKTKTFGDVFTGVSIPFKSNLMKIKIPFISTGGADDGTFTTNVNGFLIRENSQQECLVFWKNRATALQRLESGRKLYIPAKYKTMEDNGC